MSTNTKKQTTNNTPNAQSEEEKLTALSKYSPIELDSTPGIYKVNCLMAKTFNRFDPVNRFKFTLSFDLFENVPITFTSNPARDSSGKVDYSKVFGGVEYALTLSSDPNCRR